MDYESKYKNALKWAKGIYQNSVGADKEDLEHYFPELVESEDERIRKRLIVLAKGSLAHTDEEIDEMLAWLEKQGNQKEQLINKACGLLVDCIEDFMSRGMEIWGEESKKQTLENLRKAMKGE